MRKPKKIICPRGGSQNYSILSSGTHLKPINGIIYWHLDESTLSKDMEKYKLLFAFQKTFENIQPFILPIKFESTSDPNKGQIIFRFKNNGDTGLPQKFGNGVLAYAYSPFQESLNLNADVFINDLYNWQDMHKLGSFYLLKVIVHEVLHALNLGHSTNISDILYPQYQPNNDIEITLDTQKGLFDLYKQYGVKNPISDVSSNTLLKLLFKTKSDLSILTKNQLNILADYLGIVFSVKDTTQSKLNKLLTTIINLK